MPSLWDWNHPTVWLFTSKTASSSWLSSYQDESWDWHAYLLLFTGKAALLQNNFVRKYSRANKIPSFLTTVLVKLVVSKFWTKKEKKKDYSPALDFRDFVVPWNYFSDLIKPQDCSLGFSSSGLHFPLYTPLIFGHLHGAGSRKLVAGPVLCDPPQQNVRYIKDYGKSKLI